jgi:hypothetical protein
VNSLEMELQEALQSLDKLKKEKDMTLMKDHCLTVLPTVDQQTDRESCDLYGGSEAEREEEEIAECTSADEGVPLIPTLERLGKSKHTKDKVSLQNEDTTADSPPSKKRCINNPLFHHTTGSENNHVVSTTEP